MPRSSDTFTRLTVATRNVRFDSTFVYGKPTDGTGLLLFSPAVGRHLLEHSAKHTQCKPTGIGVCDCKRSCTFIAGNASSG